MGGLNFRLQAEKAKARPCFNRCLCYRVQSTRFLAKIKLFDIFPLGRRFKPSGRVIFASFAGKRLTVGRVQGERF